MIFIYIYFAINIFTAGMSVSDSYTKGKNLKGIYVCLFFGVIFILYYIVPKDRLKNWWIKSNIRFYLRLYVLKEYDNLSDKQIDYVKNELLAEKELKTRNKIIKILKRNGI